MKTLKWMAPTLKPLNRVVHGATNCFSGTSNVGGDLCVIGLDAITCITGTATVLPPA